jgi:hypothetical protein
MTKTIENPVIILSKEANKLIKKSYKIELIIKKLLNQQKLRAKKI